MQFSKNNSWRCAIQLPTPPPYPWIPAPPHPWVLSRTMMHSIACVRKPGPKYNETPQAHILLKFLHLERALQEQEHPLCGALSRRLVHEFLFLFRGIEVCTWTNDDYLWCVLDDNWRGSWVKEVERGCLSNSVAVKETREVIESDRMMDLDDLSNFWARFQISFSWDYPAGLDVQAVQAAVFHVVGDSDTRWVF